MSTTLAPERVPREPGARRAAAPAPASRRLRRAPGLDLLFTAVFALFGFALGLEPLADNSFFTHLVTGHYILDHGIPRVDPYSFTAPGAEWVAQSWLAEVLYAGLDRSFGPFAIRVLGATTTAAVAVLAFRLALRLSRDRLRAALLTVAALAGLFVLWSERPLLLGLLGLMVLLWVVEVPDSWVGRHPLVVLPVLFWLWVNVHGSFALGVGYLGLHLLGRWLDGARPWQGREARLLAGAAVAGVVVFLNPYGPALVLFPLHLLGRGDILRHVNEWKSPDFRTVWGQPYLLWLAVFVAVVARGRNRVTRRDLVVTVPFLLLALWALRNVAIAPLVCLPVAARAVAVDAGTARARRAAEQPSGAAWVAVAVLAAVTLGIVGRAAGRPDVVTTGYPVAAMAALEQRGLIGSRLFMDDGAAAYAELAYWPEQHVFLDDRYDMFPPEVVFDYLAITKGGPRALRLLDAYDVETVVWERRSPLADQLGASEGWTRIHRDRYWVAFERTGR